ncbi:MAG: ribosome maturation factor RimP [Deltaproteobacteria bacterium]
MSKKSIAQRVEDMALPIVETAGYELVDVEYIKEGQNWYLRLYIDKQGGITIEDCETISEKINHLLDEEDFIPNSYFFEVSSPGLERILKKEKEFEKYKGEMVEVKLYKPINKKNLFEGELVGLIDGKVVINYNNERMEFDRQDVAFVKKIFKFN